MAEILIADDEPNQIELMKFNLEKNGFLIKSAFNGEQALDMIIGNNIVSLFDLSILHSSIPDIFGIIQSAIRTFGFFS